jgi:hypothetical protein
MTSGNGIIEIVRQNWSFWYSLVVCEARVIHLIIHGTTLKTAVAWRAFFIINPKTNCGPK